MSGSEAGLHANGEKSTERAKLVKSERGRTAGEQTREDLAHQVQMEGLAIDRGMDSSTR